MIGICTRSSVKPHDAFELSAEKNNTISKLFDLRPEWCNRLPGIQSRFFTKAGTSRILAFISTIYLLCFIVLFVDNNAFFRVLREQRFV